MLFPECGFIHGTMHPAQLRQGKLNNEVTPPSSWKNEVHIIMPRPILIDGPCSWFQGQAKSLGLEVTQYSLWQLRVPRRSSGEP